MLRFTLDGVKQEFDEKRLMNVEAIAIARFGGQTTREFIVGLSEMDATSMTAMVWIVRKRAGDDVKFTDVEFNLMELIESIEEDTDEPAGETDEEPDPISPESPDEG